MDEGTDLGQCSGMSLERRKGLGASCPLRGLGQGYVEHRFRSSSMT